MIGLTLIYYLSLSFSFSLSLSDRSFSLFTFLSLSFSHIHFIYASVLPLVSHPPSIHAIVFPRHHLTDSLKSIPIYSKALKGVHYRICETRLASRVIVFSKFSFNLFTLIFKSMFAYSGARQMLSPSIFLSVDP